MGISVSIPPCGIMMIGPFHGSHLLQSFGQIFQQSGLIFNGGDTCGGARNKNRDLAFLETAFGHYGFIAADAPELGERIRQLAKEEGLKVADLENEFGLDDSLFLPDNLHPNEDGTSLIAATFAKVLNKLP